MSRGYSVSKRSAGLTSRKNVRKVTTLPVRESKSPSVGTRYDFHRRALSTIAGMMHTAPVRKHAALDSEWWHHRNCADRYHRAMLLGESMADIQARSVLPKDWDESQ